MWSPQIFNHLIMSESIVVLNCALCTFILTSFDCCVILLPWWRLMEKYKSLFPRLERAALDCVPAIASTLNDKQLGLFCCCVSLLPDGTHMAIGSITSITITLCSARDCKWRMMRVIDWWCHRGPPMRARINKLPPGCLSNDRHDAIT